MISVSDTQKAIQQQREAIVEDKKAIQQLVEEVKRDSSLFPSESFRSLLTSC
jgi:hypothetical protein